MKKIANTADLREEILSLEIRLANDREALKNEFKAAYKRITLANLIRKTAKELAEAPDFKHNLLTAFMSLGAGILSRKLVIGSSRNPIKKVLGALVQAGVTKIVSANSDTLKSAGTFLVKKLLHRNHETVSEER